jgi:hypothetical protein
VHVQRENDDSFDEEIQQVFEHFSQHNMQILSGDCNAKLGKEDIFKTTFSMGSLQ